MKAYFKEPGRQQICRKLVLIYNFRTAIVYTADHESGPMWVVGMVYWMTNVCLHTLLSEDLLFVGSGCSVPVVCEICYSKK